MIREILQKFINNIPNPPQSIDVNPKNILGITLPSIEEVDELPENIRVCGRFWWLRSPGDYSDYAAIVFGDGYVGSSGTDVIDAEGGVRPLLLTNLKSSNLKLYNHYDFLGNRWIYIGKGKFLSENIITQHRFNPDPYLKDYYDEKISYKEYEDLCKKAEINNYDKSEIKQFVENWLKERINNNLSEGYFDKEVYERKTAYANRLRNYDREHSELTDDQCDVLDWLTTLRHEMHTHQTGIFHSESADCDKFSTAIDFEINNKLSSVGFRKINFPNIEDFPTDYDYEDLGYDDFQDAERDCIELMEEVNRLIEDFLKEIDEKYNTSYCPTGKTRFYY